MKKGGWIGLGVWLLTGCFALSVSAGVTPYANYSYDFWGNPVEMPACYTPAAVCLGRETGAGDFKAPQDLFVDSRRQIYVADTGNNRLVILDYGGGTDTSSVEEAVQGFLEPLLKQ